MFIAAVVTMFLRGDDMEHAHSRRSAHNARDLQDVCYQCCRWWHLRPCQCAFTGAADSYHDKVDSDDDPRKIYLHLEAPRFDLHRAPTAAYIALALPRG
jgi:hypothetical protein